MLIRRGKLTINGKLPEEDTIYSVRMPGNNNYIDADHFCGCPMPQAPKDKMELTEANPAALVNDALYGAMAISFNNSDLVETLEISVFGGQSTSYVICSDGLVIVNNTGCIFRKCLW